MLSDYKKIKKIGKGSYGEVWLADYKNNRKCVLKKIVFYDDDEKYKKSARSECEFLKKLKHPNIVQYYDSIEFADCLYISMSYCEGGDLFTTLQNRNGNFLSERQIIEWFIQIVMALSYIHEQKILHRDLKTQNIFLAKNSVIKVGDLGIAKQLQSKFDMASTFIGTPYYMSPEILKNQQYNYKTDIWSLGCVTYEMATLKTAFIANDYDSLCMLITRGDTPPMPSIYCKGLTDLIVAMLSNHPNDRPSTNKILRAPFIRKHITDFLDSIKRRKFSSSSDQSTNGRGNILSVVNKSRSNGSSPHNISPERPGVKFILEPISVACSIATDVKLQKVDNESSVYNSSIQKERRPSRTVLEQEIDKHDILVQRKVSSPRGAIPVPIIQSTSSPQISINRNVTERQSARDRRRERNRNNGLQTMIRTSDEDIGNDPVSDDTNRLSARDRRRNSSESEQILILPRLRRFGDDSGSCNADDVARNELSNIFAKMKETLKVSQDENYDAYWNNSPKETVCNSVSNCSARPVVTQLPNKAYNEMSKYVPVS